MNGAGGHLARAQVFFEFRRYADCVKAAQEAIAADPQSPEGYLLLSHGYVYQPGKKRLALEAAEKAVSLAPERSDLLAWSAGVLMLANKKRRALQVATDALAQNPQEIAALVARAQSYSQWKDSWSKAEADLRAALGIEPQNITVRCLLAQALRMQDRFAESKTIIDDVLRDAPRDCFTLTQAGWSAIEASDLATAAKFVKGALAIEPENEFARRTWFEILRRRIFIYRWETAWREHSLALIQLDFRKNKKLWLLVVIPHAGVILACLFTMLFMTILTFWVMIRCLADYFICLDRTTRYSLTSRQWHWTLAKGLLLFPAFLYSALTLPVLRTSVVLFGVVTLIVIFFQGIGKMTQHIFARLRPSSQ